MKKIELTIIHDEEEYVFSGEGDVLFFADHMPTPDYFKENKIDPLTKRLARVNAINGCSCEDARNKQRIFRMHDKCTLKTEDDFYIGEYATWSRINGQPIIIVDM